MADDYLNTTATTAFEMAVEFQLNELDHEFETQCDWRGGVTGEKVEITDRFGDLGYEEVDSRFKKTELQENTVERRWMHKPNRLAVHTGLDPDDVMATEIPLDSPLAVGVARGIKRARQDQFLFGFHGPAFIGKEGTTAVPFKSSNVLPADAGAGSGNYRGLTRKKLTMLRTMARKLLIDPRDPNNKLNMGITADEIEDLLEIDEYVRAEYNPDSQTKSNAPMSSGAKQALQDGEPTDWLGIHWVPMEFTNPKAFPKSAALGLNAQGHRRCPVWVRSGIAGREWMGIETHRDRRPDLSHSWQLSAYSCLRYGRVHEDKCFIVECAD